MFLQPSLTMQIYYGFPQHFVRLYLFKGEMEKLETIKRDVDVMPTTASIPQIS